jgi:tetratricopeptide (TPR) repeat protein
MKTVSKIIAVLIISLFISLSVLNGVHTQSAQAAQSEEKKPPPPKTINIGVTTFHTQEVDFKEILAIAKKEKKLVLAVFGDVKHPLWKRAEKKVFYDESIHQVAQEAVLYYVGIDKPRGKELAKKYKPVQYPAFTLFSADGKILHTNYFGYMFDTKAADLLEWLYEIKEGRGPKPRQKTITIGQVKWYTEQNSLEQIIAAAKKENKPILMVYTNYSNRRSKKALSETLESEQFAATAPLVVLLNIEKTGPQSADYIKKFELRYAPRAILFSKEGKILERDLGSIRNVETFCQWLTDAVAGDNKANLAKRVENEPENRLTMMKLARKMKLARDFKIVDILRRVINLNPDIYDPLTHEAHERLASFLYRRVRFLEEVEKKKFIEIFNEDFMAAYNNYYPDNFKYTLKRDRDKYSYILTWLNSQDKPNEGASYFKDFVKSLGDSGHGKKLLAYFRTIEQGVELLLKRGRESEAEKWLERMNAAVQEMDDGTPEGAKKNFGAKFMLSQVYTPFVAFYAKKGEIQQAESYGKQALQAMGQSEDSKKMKESIEHTWARKHGIFANQYIAELDRELASVTDRRMQIRVLSRKAIYLAKSGKIDQAEKILRELAEAPPENVKSLARYYFFISGSMIEAGILTDETLSLAKKAVSLEPSAPGYWVLAKAYAAKGNFSEAIKTLEKALPLTKHERQIKSYRDKLELWRLF